MFTRPPDVADADLAAALADGWEIDVVALEYVAVGFGSHHWKASSPSGSWFVTVDDLVAKRGEPDEPVQEARERLVAALSTASALSGAGFDFVVVPRPTTDGQIVRDVGDRYVAAVYPFVRGETHGYGDHWDPSQLAEVVDHLAALHRSPRPCRRWARLDTLSVPRLAELTAACEQLGEPWDCGPFAEPTRRLLVRHAGDLSRALDRCAALASVVGTQTSRLVLTHGEPHRGNTITTDRGVVLVDWDTALIAPPERDLWSLVRHDPAVVAQYEASAGARVDDDTLDLYRLGWDLGEIALYVSDFCQQHERTDDTDEAWRNLQHHLDPRRW